MTAYRRNFIPGGCFFFTVNLADRRLRLLTENVETLRFAIRETRQRHPFMIDAMVVLPVAVGWVERSETHQFVTQAGHDRVPSQFQPPGMKLRRYAVMTCLRDELMGFASLYPS